MCLFILLELLLIFDKSFSKFHLYGPFHLFDVLLLLLTVISGLNIIKRRPQLHFVPILLLVAIAVLYAVYSLYVLHSPLNYTVRQFAVIVYIVCTYLIFSSYTNSTTNGFNIRFIILIAIAASVLQIGYHLIKLLTDTSFIENLFDSFNHVSELGFMALLVLEVLLLVYMKQWWKYALLLFLFLLMLTLGHQGSIVILYFFILGLYLFLRVNKGLKTALLAAGALGLGSLFYLLPEYFADHNTMWRVLYWQETIHEVMITKFGILGHGFGIVYTSPEILELMKDQINSPMFEFRPEEQYLSPMHNSFLTIAYHIGFVVMLLIFVPLKNVFAYLFNRKDHQPTVIKDFLVLSLFAVIGWSSFHVVLELPHSSVFFWLIYFTTLYHFNVENKVTT